jgi:peptidoglycan/xylan/chitin deacetylase (PgdA/CDA1 family)
VFRAHLEYLRRHFNVISLPTLMEHYLHGRALPPNPVVLTFDDGYRSNYSLAYPLLREYGMPATIFLTTDFVDAKRLQWTDRVEYAIDHASGDAVAAAYTGAAADLDPRALRGALLIQFKSRMKRVPQEQRAQLVDELEATLGCSLATAPQVPDLYRPLDWPEVREMLASGLVSIGSHTASHFILSRCAPEVVREDLRSAKRIIEERLDAPCPLFCYPNGGRGDFDDSTRAIVQEAGHTCALTTVVGFNDSRSDVYELKRVGVFNWHTFTDFEMMVSGVTPRVMALGDGLRKLGLRN